MDSNQDNYDLGYIQIIEREKDLYKNYYLSQTSAQNKTIFQSINNGSNDCHIEYGQHSNQLIHDNCHNNYEQHCNQQTDENVQRCYELVVINGNSCFVSKYNYSQTQQEMVSRINKHLNDQQLDREMKFDPNKSESNVNNDEMINIKRRVSYTCKWIGCGQQFKYLKPYLNHLNKHSTKERLEGGKKDGQQFGSRGVAFSGLDEHIEVLKNNGKELFACKWKECGFKSYLMRIMSRHIRSKHMSYKPFDDNEYNDKSYIFTDNKRRYERSHSKASEICQKTEINTNIESDDEKPVLVNNEGTHLESHSISSILIPQNLIKTELIEPVENEVLTNNDDVKPIENRSNIILSCKGLTSTQRVKNYFERKIINGEKKYFCRFRNCQFNTGRTQRIAEHINLTHVGMNFRCDKPNCSKIFRNPHSYREHQKNHICGFGIDGQTVIGVCRTENLFRYRERVVIDGSRFYRCIWNGCGTVSKYRTAMKRHIHGQHICPQRANAKKNQNHVISEGRPGSNSSEPVANISTANKDNKEFVGQRYKCNSKFSVYQDLLKRKNFLCKSRKVSKTSSSMQTMVNKSNNLQLISNYAKQYQLFIESRNKFVSEVKRLSNSKVDKYFVTKRVNGVNYYLCKWNECKFRTKFLNKAVEHIETKHMGSQPNAQKTGLKRKYTSLESQKMTDIRKVNLNEKVEVHVNKSVDNESKPSTSNYKELQNIDKIKEYIVMKSIDCEPNYLCKWQDCKHLTNSFNEMTRHIKQTHISFKSSKQ